MSGGSSCCGHSRRTYHTGRSSRPRIRPPCRDTCGYGFRATAVVYAFEGRPTAAPAPLPDGLTARPMTDLPTEQRYDLIAHHRRGSAGRPSRRRPRLAGRPRSRLVADAWRPRRRLRLRRRASGTHRNARSERHPGGHRRRGGRCARRRATNRCRSPCPLANVAATDYLLGRRYRLDPFTMHLLEDHPDRRGRSVHPDQPAVLPVAVIVEPPVGAGHASDGASHRFSRYENDRGISQGFVPSGPAGADGSPRSVEEGAQPAGRSPAPESRRYRRACSRYVKIVVVRAAQPRIWPGDDGGHVGRSQRTDVDRQASGTGASLPDGHRGQPRGQHLGAIVGQDRLRMELDALDRVLAMPDTHDQPVGGPGGHLEHVGQRVAGDGQRVVPTRIERGGEVPRRRPDPNATPPSACRGPARPG